MKNLWVKYHRMALRNHSRRGNGLFPLWERIIPAVGTNHSHNGNIIRKQKLERWGI